MKTTLALIGTLFILTSCAQHPTKYIVTKGPLICNTEEVCPELSFRWLEQSREGFKISADIASSQPYEIKQFEFLVDGQPYLYSTIEPTQHSIKNQQQLSSNSIHVPVSFLNSFRDGKQIDLKLVTDQGDIQRPILKENGEKSSAFLTFLKGYITPNH